jgi:hypothetical protein
VFFSYLQVKCVCGAWVLGLQTGLELAQGDIQHHLPQFTGHPPSTWGIEVVDVEARITHDARHFLKL